MQRLFALALVATTTLAVGLGIANAQFGPPQTIFGSIVDSAGPVPEKLLVEAYIDDKVCGKGVTEFAGEGASRVTVFAVDVVAKEQTAGCGADGAEVRIKIGDRFATQRARWRQGPLQIDITFGQNATPAPIPTFTPVPPTATRQATSQAAATGTAVPASATVSASPSAAATDTSTGAVNRTTPTATLRGGVVSSVQGGSGSGGDDGGFPLWGVALIVLGGVGLAGGGVGLLMARARNAS